MFSGAREPWKCKWENPISASLYTYRSWKSMLYRCYKPRNARYHYYGGRGIKVCDRWKDNYDFFVADMGFRPQGKTLDRKDGNKDYSPENCQWATPREQALNRQKRRKVLNYDL